MTYFSLPLFYKLNIKKTSISLGVQISYSFIHNGSADIHSMINGIDSTYSTTFKYGKPVFHKFNYGLKSEIVYLISNNFALNLDYFYALNPTLSYCGVLRTRPTIIQQVTFGICYYFLKFNEKYF